MSTQQLVSVMGKKTQVNPMLMKNDMSFVQSLYDTGVAPVQGTVTNKNKDMFQNEERIQSMISNGNLDYVSKKGFLQYKVIRTNEDIVLDGTYNTLYTVFNPSNPVTGVDIEVKFNNFTTPVLIALPANNAITILVDGVGNVTPSGYGTVSLAGLVVSSELV